MNYICSTIIIVIFSPLITTSCFHFKNTTLFNMMCKPKALALWAITITCLTHYAVRRYTIACHPLYSPRTGFFEFRTVLNPVRNLQHPRIANRTVVCILHSFAWAHRQFSYLQFVSYGWRNRSGSENVCRSPRSGFQCLSLYTADSPCSGYLSGHMCASRRVNPVPGRFTHIPLGHGCWKVSCHMIMSGHLIVQQFQSFECFDTPF